MVLAFLFLFLICCFLGRVGGGGGPRLPSAQMHIIKDILWAKMEIMLHPLTFQDAKYRSNHSKKDDYS